MILTCPECAASYFVDDAQIGPSGRMVKCASCGARWTASPPLELSSSPEEGALAHEPSDLRPGPSAAAELAGGELPKVYRAKAETKRKVRQAATTGVVWAAMAAGLAVLLALAALFRADIVRLWPRTAGAYAAVGLPVNSLGLVIENLRAEPTLQSGHAALAVVGSIRNIESRPILAPALRVSLLNKAGKTVAVQIARPAQPRIPAGATRHFALTLMDPPATSSELEAAFDVAAPRKAGVVAHDPSAVVAPKANLKLRGAADAAPPPQPQPAPAPLEAVPLAPSDPQAASHG